VEEINQRSPAINSPNPLVEEITKEALMDDITFQPETLLL